MAHRLEHDRLVGGSELCGPGVAVAARNDERPDAQ
jgi:hypothetical protein